MIITVNVDTKSLDVNIEDSVYNTLTSTFIPNLNTRIEGTDTQPYTLKTLLDSSLLGLLNQDPTLTDQQLIAKAVSACYNWSGVPEPVVEAPLDAAALKTMLKLYAAEKRYTVETGGLTVNGVFYATDRVTQNAIARAFLCLANGALTEPIDWKGTGGWVQLTQANLLDVARVVSNHVQSAFTKERLVSEAIDNGTITTKEAVNNYGW